MLDINTLSEQIFSSRVSSGKMEEFSETYGVSVETIKNLMTISYLNHLKGSCYTTDIEEMYVKNKRNLDAKIKYACIQSRRKAYITAKEAGSLGYSYKITIKGNHFLNQYISWLKENERDYFYRIRLNNAKKAEEDKKIVT